MGRSTPSASISTARDRAKHAARGRPYWHQVSADVHLGYRKNKEGAGRWVVRAYVGGGQYKVASIGVADDDRPGADFRKGRQFDDARLAAAEPSTVLDYPHAVRKAVLRAAELHVAPAAESAPLTVQAAIDDYLEKLRRDGRASSEEVARNLRNHVTDELRRTLVTDLTKKQLETWRNAIHDAPRRRRPIAGQPTRYYPVDSSQDARSKRAASANRIFAALRAALNLASDNHPAAHANRNAWRDIEMLTEQLKGDFHHFTEPEAKALLGACDADFYRMARAALETGARYSELCRLLVGDLLPADDARTAWRLRVRRSKSGKPRDLFMSSNATTWFLSLAEGRPADAPLIVRADGSPWFRGQQTPPMTAACERAGLDRRGIHSLRHTWASIAYGRNVPVAEIARQLGHNSERMVMERYGRLRPGARVAVMDAATPEY